MTESYYGDFVRSEPFDNVVDGDVGRSTYEHSELTLNKLEDELDERMRLACLPFFSTV